MTASCIIAWVRGLVAVGAPRCAGAAMSRALLNPIPDWLALTVACVKLSCVKPGRRVRETTVQPRRRFQRLFLLQDRVAVHPQDVVDAADSPFT